MSSRKYPASMTEDNLFSRNPFIELKVMQAVNLKLIMEDLEEVHPYILVVQEDLELESSLAKYTKGTYIWGEVMELDLDLSQPFKILICDKDEYGSDTTIAGFIVPPSFMETISETLQQFWLPISPPADAFKNNLELQDMPLLDHAMLASPNDDLPMLLIEARYIDPDFRYKYVIEFGKHRNIIEAKQSYTVYEACVNRNDSLSWKVELRFSQVNRLRNEMVQVLPSLKSVPFPRKTYFDWVGLFCFRMSKFDQDRIRTRKQQMEAFINKVLEHSDSIRSDTLDEVLNIPKY